MATKSPREITKELLAGLPERSRAILVDRFGLKQRGGKRTLESIGREYNITRERVRQIENHGLAAIRASEAYANYQDALNELKDAIDSMGGVVAEDMLVRELAAEKGESDHVLFLLTVGQPFNYEKESNDFISRWHVNPQLSEQVHTALLDLASALDTSALIPQDEFFQKFEGHLKDTGVKRYTPEHLPRWLALSKRIAVNPLGEWGRADSPHVRVKSMRDFAYLTLKRHGSPMHFMEVAKAIEQLFGRKAHPATCHNELINDPRFVLVGRGLYALSEWGYAPGVVRDVIRGILVKEGPLTREEIVERVKRERYVKDATIAVNLQDPMFIKTSDGKYTLAQ